MTVHEEHGHAHAGARSEEDRISTPTIIAVGIASLLVFVVASGIVMAYFKKHMTQAVLPPVPAEVGQSKIGMVEQQLFEVSLRGTRDREVRRERLGSYGWVDRRAGVVHIPIDQAMQLVAKGVRAKSGAAQEERRIGGQP